MIDISCSISFELSPAKGTLLNWSRFFDESAFLFFGESPASKGHISKGGKATDHISLVAFEYDSLKTTYWIEFLDT